MHNQSDYLILEGAHLSEKASIIADESRQFTFKVSPSSTKPGIKRAVEKMFEVEVDSVNVTIVKGKKKGRMSRNPGQRKGWKKAYVTLKPGFDIEFTALK